MFNSEQDPLSLLIEITPKLAKKRYRQSIYEAWDHCCGYCGDKATSLDHIIPRFKSGSSNRNNLIPACRRCNQNKASTEIEEWYTQQAFFSDARLTKIKNWMNQEPIDIFVYNSGNPSLGLAS
jgi:5-methylcytosine-specific restriction endonuclease McrA